MKNYTIKCIKFIFNANKAKTPAENIRDFTK